MYIAALKSKLQKNVQQSLYYNKYLVLKNYTKYMLMIILKWFMLGLAEKTNLRTSFFVFCPISVSKGKSYLVSLL